MTVLKLFSLNKPRLILAYRTGFIYLYINALQIAIKIKSSSYNSTSIIMASNIRLNFFLFRFKIVC